MEASVSLKTIGKRINKKIALAGLSFGIEKKSKFAILGPHSSGKSTIIKLLSGVIYKDKGYLYINGKDTNVNPLEIKSEIGYMPQKNDFYKDLTILDNISLFGEIFNMTRKQSKEQAVLLCEKLNLSDYMYEKSKNINNSINRMAMFARAILHNPEIIILDQPSLDLDLKCKNLLWDFLFEYGSNKTIIYSTNKISEVENNSDRVAVVNDYEIKYIGTYKFFLEGCKDYTLKDIIY